MLAAGVGTLEQHAWQSPTALRSNKPVSGSRGLVACRGRLPAQSYLCASALRCCFGPWIGRREAGETPGTASCPASSCLPLQGLGPAAGLEVGVHRGARAIAPSTIAPIASGPARLFVGECLGVGWPWGGCRPTGAGPETPRWIPVAAEARGLTLPSGVAPGLVRCRRGGVGPVVGPADA